MTNTNTLREFQTESCALADVQPKSILCKIKCAEPVFLFRASVFVFFLLLSTKAFAANIQWVGSAGDGNWNTPTNWNAGIVPTIDDDVVIDSNTIVLALASDAAISFKTLVLGRTNSPTLRLSTGTVVDCGALTVKNKATLEENSSLSLYFSSITVETGGRITHTANTTTQQYVLSIITTGDFLLQSGATVYLDNAGYAGGATGASGNGPGASVSGPSNVAGAGHAGYGGAGTDSSGGTPYGNWSNPATIGSGAANGGGRGGGAFIAVIGGTATFDGLITANGAKGGSSGGGGGGGAINIRASTISGTGILRTNGGNSGNANTGGGSAGYVMLSADNSYQFTGILQAYPGTGWQSGATGPILKKSSSESYYSLSFDGGSPRPGGQTPVSAIYSLDSLSIATAAVVLSTLTIHTDCNLSNGSKVQFNRPISVGGNMTIASSSQLEHAGNISLRTNMITLSVAGNMDLQSGTTIYMDGRGYARGAATADGNGPGKGLGGSGNASGGGHIGYGGNSQSGMAGGIAYDNGFDPQDFGSGGGGGINGPGGAGAGAMILTVSGNVNLNGFITARGNNVGNSGGAGAGGSINISANTITGSGIIRVDGGNATSGGGGGAGGIILLKSSGNYGFTGRKTAIPGTGYQNGGAGIVFERRGNGDGYNATVDGGPTMAGAWSDIPTESTLASLTVATAAISASTFTVTGDVTLLYGTVGAFNRPLTVGGNFTMGTGAWLRHGSNSTTKRNWLTLSVAGDFIMQPGATIAVSGMGYAGGGGNSSGNGPGKGIFSGAYCSGGGAHAGNGGSCSGGAGGTGYDMAFSPYYLGSGGGGSGENSNVKGGAGGGLLTANVGGTARLNGLIAANGGNGGVLTGSYASGGGAGGAVVLSATNIEGNGTVTANGGNGGGTAGGGGGGGFVVLSASATYSFAGSKSVMGGTGSQNGGAGIISERKGLAAGYSVTIDGGRVKTTLATPISSDVVEISSLLIGTASVAFSTLTVHGDITLAMGAMASFNNPVVVDGNLIMLTGAQLRHGSNSSTKRNWLNLFIGRDFTLQPGSTITLVGRGYAGGATDGPGYGPGKGTVPRYGGGHGGAGSPSYGTSGLPYDSAVNPVELGSGGGGGIYYGGSGGTGGAGGGALIMTANGNATLNGLITVNGNDGAADGAGGSGGTVNITAAVITGSGTITANGGSGGGGGGIVALNGTSFLNYGGILLATAGTGQKNGGTGTVALHSNSGPYKFIVDGASVLAGELTSITDVVPVESLYVASSQLSGVSMNVSNYISLASTATLSLPQVQANNIYISSKAFVALNNTTLATGDVTAGAGAIVTVSSFSAGANIFLSTGAVMIQSAGYATLAAGADIYLAPSATLSAASILSASNFHMSDYSKMSATALIFPGPFTLPNNSSLTANNISVNGDFVMYSGSKLMHRPNSTQRLNWLSLNVTGDWDLQPGSMVYLDGLGYTGGVNYGGGNGAGKGSYTSGAGHGGLGGAGVGGGGGAVYDYIFYPIDLGSGGAGGYGIAISGGSGGGTLIANISGSAHLNGIISANGAPGKSFGSRSGGGGAGGSINVTASNIDGSGFLQANGSAAGGSDAGAGGGGRILISYPSGAFMGGFSVTGGTVGYKPGATGTAVDNGKVIFFSAPGAGASVALALSTTAISTSDDLTENLKYEDILISGVVSTGTLTGFVSYNSFALVTVRSGGFTGKGFARSYWTATLSGVPYSGELKAMAVYTAADGKVYIKGATTGDITGTFDGYISETTPGSGIYNQYYGTWHFNRLKTITSSGTLYLSGSASRNSQQDYSGVSLKLGQENITGNVDGYVSGSLNATLTHMRINSAGNPYNNEGFVSFTYTDSSGTGKGWTYANKQTNGFVSLRGIMDNPSYGMLSGSLADDADPKTIMLNLERVDLGPKPQTQLDLDIFGPDTMNVGESTAFMATVTNNGTLRATNISLEAPLPDNSIFVSVSPGGSYSLGPNVVWWPVDTLNPGQSYSGWFYFKLPNGFPGHTDVPLSVSIGYLSADNAMLPYMDEPDDDGSLEEDNNE